MNLQLKACQKVLSANNNQLENQSNTIKTLEVANSRFTSRVSILEADFANQEQKICNLESNLDKISKFENLISQLVEQGDKSNAKISQLANQVCKCPRSQHASSQYMTDENYSFSSSDHHGNSDENCSFSNQPPICTIDILTPEHSRQTRHESSPAGKGIVMKLMSLL